MKTLQTSLLYLLFIAVIIGQISCSRGKTVKQGDDKFGNYISSHTDGVVSKASTIFVTFNDQMVADSLVGIDIEKAIIKLSPHVEGICVWQDNKTLLFKPNHYLESGIEYKAIIDLAAVYEEIHDNIKTAEFVFQTRVIQFYIGEPDINLIPPDYVKFKIQFNVSSSDVIDQEEINDIFKLNSEDSQEIKFTLSHQGKQNFTISIEEYIPTTDGERITISWRANDRDLEREFFMPGSVGFELFDYRIENDGRTYVKLIFNKMLDSYQKLEGLIELTGDDTGLTFLRNGNVVQVFFNKSIHGDRVLKLSGKLRSSAMEDLGNDKILNIYFHDFEPAIQLIGRGSIVPFNNGIIFPFKTINLTAVDIEIVKIFPNNILQYLQSAESEYRINEVGRIVYQNKIDLEKVSGQIPLLNNWESYALDLANFIEMEPKAIYQIRLGFRPQYVKNLDCADSKLLDVPDLVLKQGDEDFQSIYDDNYYGFSGYEDGYWEGRDDPCRSSFYNNSRFVKRNVFASNLGVMVKKMDNGRFNIFTTDLLTAEPKEGVNVNLYDFQQQLVASGKTNINGEVELNSKREVRFLTASLGKDNSYMRIFDGEGLSMTNFDITGITPVEGLKGYFFAERDIWRPGDSVFMNLIVESSGVDLAENITVDVALTDPLGRQFLKKTYFKQKANMFSFPFLLPADALTGNWQLSAKIGGSEFRRTVAVETIKPNRFALDLEIPDVLYRGDNLLLKAKAKWLTGAPASGNLVRVEKNYSSANFFSERHKDYNFASWTHRMREGAELLVERKLDDEGRMQFELDMGKLPSAPPVIVTKYNIKVFEDGGNFSNFNRSSKYYAYDNYIGIKAGNNSYYGSRLTKNEVNPIDFVCLDKKANPVPNKELEIKIFYKEKYYWWTNHSEQSLNNYISARGYNLLLNQKVTTDKNGKARLEFSPYDNGTYAIFVEGELWDNTAFMEVYAGYGGRNGSEGGGSTIIEMPDDAKETNIGDEISFTVPADNTGNFLVTVENSAGIVERFWHKAKRGDNTLKFHATAEMSPNIYINIYHYQPHNTLENDNPIRMYGVISKKVVDPSRQLHPKIETIKKVEPGDKFVVKVSEKERKNMAYTIAIVDEGLLSLTNFSTPDPHRYFNAKEALATTTWDMYDDVLGAYGARISRIFGIGGDGKAEVNAEDIEMSRFPPVVKFLGPFYLNGGKTATHNILMPNYVGNLRIMVVASDHHAFGSTFENVTVSSELMVLSTLPRQLSPKSVFKIPVTIFTDGNNSKEVTVVVEDEKGSLNFPKGKSQTFRAKAKGVETIYFDAQTKNIEGNAKIKVTARSGNFSAFEEINLQIKNPNPITHKWSRMVVKAGETITLPLESIGTDLSNSSNTIEVSSLVPFGIKSWAEYLIQYPHGCLEQITSNGFGQLALFSFFELDSRQAADVTRNINIVIDKMRNYATNQGGFAYWPSYRDIDVWSSSYAGEFLITAEKNGYRVPTNLLDHWTRSQTRLARSWVRNISPNDFHNAQNEMVQAYRLYTLALAGKPELPSMNKLRESPSLTLEARALLSMAYSISGNKTVGAKLLENMDKFDKNRYNQTYGYTYGSTLRDMALIMRAYSLADKMKEAEEIVFEINLLLQQGTWTSTQDKAQIMMAFEAFGTKQNEREKIEFSYQVDKGTKSTINLTNRSFVLELPMTEYDNKSMVINNTSKQSIFIDHVKSGKPEIGEPIEVTDRKSSLLDLSVFFYDLNNKRISPGDLVSGQEFYTVSTISNRSNFLYDLNELALTITVPDGWEIVNERVNYDQSGNPNVNYTDIRDNKIISYFNLGRGQSKVIRNRMIASFEGSYYLPASVCESMYLKNIYASTTGFWLSVKGR